MKNGAGGWEISALGGSAVLATCHFRLSQSRLPSAVNSKKIVELIIQEK
jgi:hypothetical protein